MTTSQTTSRTSSARSDAGVAAVEFALILPVLMTLLMGIIDWGYYFFMAETVVNAAREGARVGIIQDDAQDAHDQAVATAQAYLTNVGVSLGDGANQAQVSVTPAGSLVTDPDAGNVNLTVTVSIASFTGLTGFLTQPFIPTGVQYQSTMRWEMADPP